MEMSWSDVNTNEVCTNMGQASPRHGANPDGARCIFVGGTTGGIIPPRTLHCLPPAPRTPGSARTGTAGAGVGVRTGTAGADALREAVVLIDADQQEPTFVSADTIDGMNDVREDVRGILLSIGILEDAPADPIDHFG